jgi:hypothetical protein
MPKLLLFTLTILLAIALASCSDHAGAKNDPPSAQEKARDGQTKSASSPEKSNVAWRKPDGRQPRFLFIHHSTGSGFLDEGGMRDKLKAAGFDVHDRTYGDGWVGDHTDPPDFPVTFTEHFDDMISFKLEPGEKYDIVAFKSCFPASNITSDEMLQQYKDYYATIKSVTHGHPETLFIAFSTPPLVPGATNAESAGRARAFSDWLLNEYTSGEGNLKAYNLFDVLADDSGFLKREYRRDESDSHPNAAANEVVADYFTKWLSNLVG